MVEKIKSIEHQQILKNTTILNNIWHLRDDNDFKKAMQEFYDPEIWFTGKERAFETHIAKCIMEAKDSIVICSFLLEKTKITEAILKVVENSVRVYIITASENQLDKIYDLENELADERVVEHKNLLKILRKKCLIRTAPHFHAKYVLIDPKQKARVGFISSANFTKHAFSNNVEIGLQLNKDQIIDLFNLFSYIFWHESKHEYLVEQTLRSVKKPPENFINIPRLNHIISPGMNIDFKRTLLDYIKSSKGDIYLSTYSIDSKNSVFELLLEELKMGRRVKIYVRPRKNDLETLNILQLAGAEIEGHPYLHFKCLLVDNTINKRGLIFTGNITEESFEKSHDVGVFLNSKQYDTLLTILKQWGNLIPGVFIAKESVNKLPIGRYWKWNQNKNDFFIKSSEIKELKDYIGNHIDTYDDFKPEMIIPKEFEETVKEVIIRWKNTPPRLPSKSKQVKKLPEELSKKVKDALQKTKLYQEGKDFYLLYQEGDNLKELRKLSELTGYKIVIKNN